jgi:beta-glucanase (GH16 family)
VKIQWMMANWDTVEWSQEYINNGVDGSRCSIQRYLNLFDQGAPHCPWQRSEEATNMPIPDSYNLIWNDEFDTDGLVDETKWKYDTFRNSIGWYNNELQYYSSRRPENAVVANGKLQIIARIEDVSAMADYGGQKYTSARMITQDRQAWTYGYFDVRAKVPCGGGTWPAIWTLGTTRGEWPLNGEIDIMEYIGHEPNWVQGFVHTPSGYAGNGQGRRHVLEDACQDFHNYQLLWTENKLEFAVDGKKYYEYNNAGTGAAQWPFDAPQYLLLNTAIGGVLGGEVDDSIFPVTFEIEYVRVYQEGGGTVTASSKALKEKKRDVKPKSMSEAWPESKRKLRH